MNRSGNTRGGEGLKLAADQYCTLHRNKGDQGAWLEMEESRYTLYTNVGSANHPGLWLSKTGPLTLLTEDGLTIIDSVEFGPQQPDLSFGRQSDGATKWLVQPAHSPGASNGRAAE